MQGARAAETELPETQLPEKLGEQFDLVVVGSGVGGMTAALVASISGQRLLLLEKSHRVGRGTTINGLLCC